MTIEEKKQAIKGYCKSKPLCTEYQNYPCPLYNFNEDCYETEDEELINRNFTLISAMPDYHGEKESNTAYNSSKAVEVEKLLSEMSAVNHPSHYNQGGIECIDAMVAAFGKEAVANFCICNAFKYLFRHNLKNGKEDIEKAEWYLTKYKELKYVE